MSAHPGIDKVVFTGSVNTGRKVMSGAATTLADRKFKAPRSAVLIRGTTRV